MKHLPRGPDIDAKSIKSMIGHNTTLITPFKPKAWKRLLAGHPDHALVARVIIGMNLGVDVQYHGPRDINRLHVRNIPTVDNHEAAVTKEMEAEVKAGRRAGPFATPPLDHFIVSPLGAVTKPGSSKIRIIHHLSYPFGGESINKYVVHLACRLGSFDDATRLVVMNGRGCMMSKIDVQAAYRCIPVRPADWGLLGMVWKDELYFDKVLPFGLGSSCSLWEDFSNALEWIICKECNIQTITHYIDDCFVASRTQIEFAKQQLQLILAVYRYLGVPVSIDKLKGPCTVLDYLGILIDSVAMTASLTNDRLIVIRTTLLEWQQRTSCQLRELQSLVGLLNFAAKVVRPGRIFLRRMLDLLAATEQVESAVITLSKGFHADVRWWLAYMNEWNGVSVLYDLEWCVAASEASGQQAEPTTPTHTNTSENKTKSAEEVTGHYSSSVTNDDCGTTPVQVTAIPCSGMGAINGGVVRTKSMQLFTDACESGGGAVCGTAWWSHQWTQQQLHDSKQVRKYLESEAKLVEPSLSLLPPSAFPASTPTHHDDKQPTSTPVLAKRRSMPYLELLALVMAAATWGGDWKGMRIIFYNDCEPVVAAVNKGTSKSPLLMGLIRSLHFVAARHQFECKLVHIAGVTNVNADLLSRAQIGAFLRSNPTADRFPTPPSVPPNHNW